MRYEEYQRRVISRASHRWHSEKLCIADLGDVLSDFIEAGNRLDKVKKALMYGRDFTVNGITLPVEHPIPTPIERDQRLLHAMLGVATEGVEMMEAAFAYFFESKPLDLVNLQEEFGDAEWYRAFALVDLGQSHEDNIAQNDAKLEKRFGSTFSEEKANNRDLETERKTLEG